MVYKSQTLTSRVDDWETYKADRRSSSRNLNEINKQST